jgi:hypothetical protein
MQMIGKKRCGRYRQTLDPGRNWQRRLAGTWKNTPGRRDAGDSWRVFWKAKDDDEKKQVG